MLQDGKPFGAPNALHARIRSGRRRFIFALGKSHLLLNAWQYRPSYRRPRLFFPIILCTQFKFEIRYLLRSLILQYCISMVLRQQLRDRLELVKFAAVAAMLAMAPWAWLGEIYPTLKNLYSGILSGSLLHYLLMMCYLTLLLLSFIGSAVTPFLKDLRVRIALSILILAGFALDRTIVSISGQRSTAEFMQTLFREYREASSAFAAYGSAILINVAYGALMAIAFCLPPPIRCSVRSRYSISLSAPFSGQVPLP